MHFYIDKLVQRHERKEERNTQLKSSSFCGLSIPHAAPLMVSELFSRPCSGYHDISPSSTHCSIDVIVISASMTFCSVTPTHTITNPIMNSTSHVSTSPTILCLHGEGKYELSHER